jgi:hypothetical protein
LKETEAKDFHKTLVQKVKMHRFLLVRHKKTKYTAVLYSMNCTQFQMGWLRGPHDIRELLA